MIVYAHTTLIHNTSISSLIRTLLIIICISYFTPISTCIYMSFYCSMPVQKLLILTLNSHGEPQWISLYLSLSLALCHAISDVICFTCKCKSWKFKEESWGGRERETKREGERERNLILSYWVKAWTKKPTLHPLQMFAQCFTPIAQPVPYLRGTMPMCCLCVSY